MEITLSAKPGKFSFLVDSTTMVKVLDKAQGALAATPVDQRNFFLSADGKQIFLIGCGQETYVAIKLVATDVKGTGSVGINPELVGGILKGRNALDFTIEGTKLAFKATKGKYNGDINVLPVTKEQRSAVEQFLSKKAKTAVTLTKEDLDKIYEGLAVTALKDLLQGNQLSAYLQIAKKSLSISVYDQYHMAHYKAKLGTDAELRIAVPPGLMALVTKLTDNTEAVVFTVRPEFMRVDGDDFSLVLPTLQADNDKFSTATTFLKDLDKTDFEASVSAGSLFKSITNMHTLYSANANLKITHKNKQTGLSLAYTTGSGNASDGLSVKIVKDSDVKIGVDPRLLLEMLQLTKDKCSELSLSVVTDRVYILKGQTESKAQAVLVGVLAG